jgi:endonuclease G
LLLLVGLMSEPESAVPAGALPPLAERAQAALGVVLAELADAQTRTYYDAAADRIDAERYYAGVALDQLARLVTDTQRVRPRYQPATELYPWVDLQPDKTLRSLYTGHTYDPAELIAIDFRIAERRHTERTRLAALETGRDIAAVEDTVEAMLPYNCEHVMPQSWFGKAEPMRGDLHHLFACETRCNSFRGNTRAVSLGPTTMTEGRLTSSPVCPTPSRPPRAQGNGDADLLPQAVHRPRDLPAPQHGRGGLDR